MAKAIMPQPPAILIRPCKKLKTILYSGITMLFVITN